MPYEDFCGEDSFEITACDCFFDRSRSSSGTVRINVSASGEAPCGPIASCSAGEYFSVDALACEPCPPGTSANGAGQRQSCTECQPGKAQPASGATKCIDCGVGLVAMDSGAATCAPCLAGSFATDTDEDEDGAGVAAGAKACVACAAGSDPRPTERLELGRIDVV